MRSIILSTALLICAQLLAQEPQPAVPPANAKTHLAKTYPKATVKEWKQGTKLFRAEFTLKGEKHTAVYTTEGAWVRTEHDIKKDELPGTIARALKASKFGAWKIEDVEEHATPEHASLFKLKVESEKEKAELSYLPDGKLLKEEVKARKVKDPKGS
ncbi:MAG: PepSY-like domain-containing protein [Flavobacteriales bacterium]|nr:PepSY-like domain-containing protein [Flavobacteriales bacterium]